MAKLWNITNVRSQKTRIHEFVDKVIVHEADKSSGKREQRVDIHLNFIGQFIPPVEVNSEADQTEVEAEEKRAMWREYKRTQRTKKKKEQMA